MAHSTPLVSVICLCYNQSSFIAEAIGSVANQTYPNVELIVVDDKSEDESIVQIQDALEKYFPSGVLIANQENLGMCKAFNRGLAASRGDFIIDLAGDEITS